MVESAKKYIEELASSENEIPEEFKTSYEIISEQQSESLDSDINNEDS